MSTVVEVNKDQLVTTVAFLDPASGKKQEVKKVRARSAIVVVSMDTMNRVFVRYTWAERCTTDKIYAAVYDANRRFVPQVFGIESNAQQSLFCDSIMLDSVERGIDLPVKSVPQPTSVPKEFRIRTHIQPLLPNGRLFMKRDQHALLDELKTFPMSTTVDIIDALASAVSLLPKRIRLNPEDHEREAHLSYLRDSGAPISYIERVAAGQEHEAFDPEDFEDYFLSRKYRT